MRKRSKKHRHRWVQLFWLTFDFCESCNATRDRTQTFLMRDLLRAARVEART